jgi:hypothetical protein
MSYYEYKFAKVPRLSLNSICNDKIIDPLYGEINLNKYVCYLLAFPIVDRLREIKQLGLTDLVYTGATHTRLEHSFGVSYLLSKLPADLNDQERVILSLIGLLHDIGHSGWGHALDGITSKVVVEISDIIGMETFPIFSPKKLDIAITSYLLYNNDQLKRALTEIAKDLSKQQGSPVFTSSDGLRDFIAWVISEEESGDVFYCKSWKSDIVKQFEPLARYFQNLLGFKVNADRLDWIERDAHHAFITMASVHTKLEKLIEIKKGLSVRRDINNIDNVIADDYNAWNQLNEFQKFLREILYQEVYEGIARSFIDSLLIRLVYSSILVLSSIGNQIASPSAKARVIMGYIFLPDPQLRHYTEKILMSAYYSDPRSLGLSASLAEFVRNSYDVWRFMFENLRMLLSLLRRKNLGYKSKVLTTIKMASEIHINGKKYTIMYLDGQWLSIVIEMFKLASRGTNPKIAWHTLSHFLIHLRTDIIGVFRTEKIEKEINRALKSRKVKVYILPNYYFLRRLLDVTIPELIDDFNEEGALIATFSERLKKEYEGMPLVFVVVKGELNEETVKTIERRLSSHLETLLGEELSAFLGSP